jgi:putative inorganic carbon (hco3(-)) transporter
MPVRDVIVAAILFGAIPVALMRPYYGILLWYWIAIFTPHRWAYGFAKDLPAAYMVAIPTIVGAIFIKKNKHVFTFEMVLLMILWAWFGFTVFNVSLVPGFLEHLPYSTAKLIEISKILLMTVATVFLVRTVEQLKTLFAVIGFSLGLLALKGAVFGIFTGGEFRVFGTPDSYIADNNDFALALNMVLGILFFLRRDFESKKARLFTLAVFLSSAFCVILSYSRGGLLGLIAVSSLIAIKTRRKLISVVILTSLALGLATYTPPAWQARMDNLFAGHLDDSAEMRLASWAFAWNLAEHYPLTGAGFECFTPEQFQVYATRRMPGDRPASGPHSIYFQVLAEQGFVGFFLFITLVLAALYRSYKIRKRASRDERLHHLIPFTHMIDTGLVGFLVSGSFLGRAYFDLYFVLIAGLVVLTILVKKAKYEFIVNEDPEPETMLATSDIEAHQTC